MTTTETPNVWTERNANIEKYPHRDFTKDDVCVVCGRKVSKGAAMLEVSIDGEVIPEGDPRSETSESQGWWEFGSECVKRFRP